MKEGDGTDVKRLDFNGMVNRDETGYNVDVVKELEIGDMGAGGRRDVCAVCW